MWLQAYSVLKLYEFSVFHNLFFLHLKSFHQNLFVVKFLPNTC
uniref:Uncharacterized protein n=1 Tax=Rhizophora mucronata TaxID=61149 RepID=A0A2P2NS50_RHIMU